MILCDKKYGDLKWYLLTGKNNTNKLEENNIKYNYEDLIWVPIINIEDIDKFNEYNNDDYNKKDDKEEEKYTRKINKNDIMKEKEISFSSNVNNFSFHDNSEDNKNKINIINNINQKRDSIFSLGNSNNFNEENNDYNKLMEKLKITLEKLNKTEEKYQTLQKKNKELKEKIKKINNNNNLMKISISDESNDLSNGNEMGSIIGKNFNGENDIIDKLNMNKNEREHEYYESVLI